MPRRPVDFIVDSEGKVRAAGGTAPPQPDFSAASNVSASAIADSGPPWLDSAITFCAAVFGGIAFFGHGPCVVGFAISLADSRPEFLWLLPSVVMIGWLAAIVVPLSTFQRHASEYNESGSAMLVSRGTEQGELATKWIRSVGIPVMPVQTFHLVEQTSTSHPTINPPYTSARTTTYTLRPLSGRRMLHWRAVRWTLALAWGWWLFGVPLLWSALFGVFYLLGY